MERDIAIAHHLSYHKGKCANEHGHNLKVVVDIQAPKLISSKESSSGMIIDFGDIKQIIDSLDHQQLNEYFAVNDFGLDLKNQPTAERLAKYFALKIIGILESYYSIKVTIYESPTQYAYYEC
jgi:6-pyruvoyl tetrahydropterin synthase/QueD family protein